MIPKLQNLIELEKSYEVLKLVALTDKLGQIKVRLGFNDFIETYRAAIISGCMALKLSLIYDVLCPRSWVFYQTLQKKLPHWKTFREIEIDYLPISANFLHTKIYGNVHPAGILAWKKDYMLRELYEICDFYGIHKANFEVTYDLDIRRTRLCLLFLNYLRMNRPEYYQKFLEKIWSEFWHKSTTFNHTAHFFKLGRELDVPFSEMDDIIMRIDGQENRKDLTIRHFQLLFEERIVAVPWFRIDSVPGHEKLFAFTEILRLEMLDELMVQPCYNPLNHNVGNPLYFLPDNECEQEAGKESESTIAKLTKVTKMERILKPMGRAFHHLGVYTYNNFIARATWGLYPREWNPRVHGQYIHYRYYGTNTVRFYVTDGPLTVRGRSAPVKKTTNAADEIARTKFELLEPVSVVDMPRAQQRFARQLHNFNRTRVQKIFAKNITMIKNGLAGIALVIAIYMYTILVLRKETFLEEIDEEVAIERGEMIIDEQGRLVAVK